MYANNLESVKLLWPYCDPTIVDVFRNNCLLSSIKSANIDIFPYFLQRIDIFDGSFYCLDALSLVNKMLDEHLNINMLIILHAHSDINMNSLPGVLSVQQKQVHTDNLRKMKELLKKQYESLFHSTVWSLQQNTGRKQPPINELLWSYLDFK